MMVVMEDVKERDRADQDPEPVSEVTQQGADVAKVVDLTVDSGSYRHVAPPWFATTEELVPCDSAEGLPVTADGRPLEVFGQRRVRYQLPTGENVESTFLILDVKRPILSAMEMCRHGARLEMDGQGGTSGLGQQEGAVGESREPAVSAREAARSDHHGECWRRLESARSTLDALRVGM